MRIFTIRTAVTITALTGVFGLAACNNEATNTNVATTNVPKAGNSNVGVLTNGNGNTNTGVATGTKNVDYNTPDGLITAKVKLKLIGDSRVAANDVDVDTAGDVVTLSGKVDSDTAKKAAEEVAKTVSGVKTVNNQLQVVAGTAAAAVDKKDDEIADGVNHYLDDDASIKEQHLKAKVNAGVVTLNGDVDNYGTLVGAVNTIRKMPGVKSVVTTAINVKTGAPAAPAGANTNAMGANKK